MPDLADGSLATARGAERSTSPLYPRVWVALRNGENVRVFEAPLREHLQRAPDDAVALLLLAEVLRARRAFDTAEPYARRAVAVAPDHTEAHATLARLLHTQCRPASALAALQPILDRHPHDLHALRYRAALLSETGQHASAAALLRQLLQRHPEEAALWISYGDTQRVLGKREDAERAYRLGLGRQPGNGRLWWSLAALRVRFSGADVATMESALGAADADDDRAHIHFALGAAYDRAKSFARAFEHFEHGNHLQRTAHPYDPARTSADIETACRLHDRDFFAARQGGGMASSAPIFVLGMPRSGSTLVEQILASHPLIEGTAELPIIPMLAMLIGGEHGADTPEAYRILLGKLSAEERQKLGQRYLDCAQAWRRTDRPYFIDKLPYNWADIDLIQLILPNAHIVDIRRNPLDCCFSNFKLMFGQGHPSAYSLTDMAAYYRDYVRLMRDMDVALPGRIHRVIYERLVVDLEGETRRMLNHIGVPFDPACLEFHRTDRAVVTASSEQVRRPLNSEGVGASASYSAWLGPLEAALGTLVKTYDQ